MFILCLMKVINDSIVKSKNALLRCDLNIPNYDDLSRINHVIPTINMLKNANKVFIVSHYKRPNGYDESLSLKHIVPLCEKVWNVKVGFDNDHSNQFTLLENVRFDEGEETNDINLAKKWAKLADIYVNDAFSCSHRAHASIDAITTLIPSYAGIALYDEVSKLSFTNIEKPSLAIIGGAKVSTKINVIKNLAKKFDHIFIGGAMAHPFLAAKNYMNNQEFEKNKDIVFDIINTLQDKLILPVDLITKDGTVLIGEIDQDAFDIGEKSIEILKNLILASKTILWNGPLGYFEGGYMNSSIKLCGLLNGKNVIAGGGETISAIKKTGINVKFSHISTAGGAFIEFIEGRTLAGIAALNRQT